MKKEIVGVTVNGVKACVVRSVDFRKPELADNAEAIHSLKQRGIPLSDDEWGLSERVCEAVDAVLQSHCLFALQCVEACYNGDHKFFHSLYRHFDPKQREKREKEKATIKHPDSALAAITTARELGRTPTAQETVKHMESLGKKGAGLTDPRQIEKNLAKAGYVKLPADKKRGRPKKAEVLSSHSAGKTKKRKKQ